MFATNPISISSYLFGVFAGTLAGLAIQTGALTGGNLHAIYLTVFGLPYVWLLPAAMGILPFILLRKVTPDGILMRFAFVLVILAPFISFVCLMGRLSAIAEHWPTTLVVTFVGGLACWSFDQRALLLSDKTSRALSTLAHRSLPSMLLREPELFLSYPVLSADRPSDDYSARRTARYLLIAGLSALILPIILFLTCNQFLVVHQAERIAGDRPYCILVPSHSKPRGYDVATQRSQLSFINMQANQIHGSGSRVGMFATNHAVLVLENPREFLNWSYLAENFVRGSLINAFSNPCVPQLHFVETLS